MTGLRHPTFKGISDAGRTMRAYLSSSSATLVLLEGDLFQRRPVVALLRCSTCNAKGTFMSETQEELPTTKE